MYRALKTILGLNYRYRSLDLVITPSRVEWYLAVQFRRDPKRKWHPRIIVYYPQPKRVAILTELNDPEPTWVAADTIMVMSAAHTTDPKPNFPTKNA